METTLDSELQRRIDWWLKGDTPDPYGIATAVATALREVRDSLNQSSTIEELRGRVEALETRQRVDDDKQYAELRGRVEALEGQMRRKADSTFVGGVLANDNRITDEQLRALDAEAEKFAPPEQEARWKPEVGEDYCLIATTDWRGTNADKYRLANNNVFPTRAEAEAALGEKNKSAGEDDVMLDSPNSGVGIPPNKRVNDPRTTNDLPTETESVVEKDVPTKGTVKTRFGDFSWEIDPDLPNDEIRLDFPNGHTETIKIKDLEKTTRRKP